MSDRFYVAIGHLKIEKEVMSNQIFVRLQEFKLTTSIFSVTFEQRNKTNEVACSLNFKLTVDISKALNLLFLRVVPLKKDFVITFLIHFLKCSLNVHLMVDLWLIVVVVILMQGTNKIKLR